MHQDLHTHTCSVPRTHNIRLNLHVHQLWILSIIPSDYTCKGDIKLAISSAVITVLGVDVNITRCLYGVFYWWHFYNDAICHHLHIRLVHFSKTHFFPVAFPSRVCTINHTWNMTVDIRSLNKYSNMATKSGVKPNRKKKRGAFILSLYNNACVFECMHRKRVWID